jgi:hypothetical protein
MDAQTFDLFRYRFVKYVLIFITALLVVFFLLAFLRIGFIFWLWSTVETWVTVRLGLDYYAAQLVTTIVVSVVTLLLPSLAWYLLLGKRQAWGTGAMIGGQALIFILVYTVGVGVCFDRRTGEPLCWYADIPNKGRVFSRTAGFDPETGIKYKQYTREMALTSAINTPVQGAKPELNNSPIQPPVNNSPTPVNNSPIQPPVNNSPTPVNNSPIQPPTISNGTQTPLRPRSVVATSFRLEDKGTSVGSTWSQINSTTWTERLPTGITIYFREVEHSTAKVDNIQGTIVTRTPDSALDIFIPNISSGSTLVKFRMKGNSQWNPLREMVDVK